MGDSPKLTAAVLVPITPLLLVFTEQITAAATCDSSVVGVAAKVGPTSAASCAGDESFAFCSEWST